MPEDVSQPLALAAPGKRGHRAGVESLHHSNRMIAISPRSVWQLLRSMSACHQRLTQNLPYGPYHWRRPGSHLVFPITPSIPEGAVTQPYQNRIWVCLPWSSCSASTIVGLTIPTYVYTWMFEELTPRGQSLTVGAKTQEMILSSVPWEDSPQGSKQDRAPFDCCEDQLNKTLRIGFPSSFIWHLLVSHSRCLCFLK